MKSLIVSMFIFALIITAVVAVQDSDAQVKQGPARPPVWEYKLLTITKMIEGATEENAVTASLEKHFNTLGNDGWEFCQEMNGGLVFKRRK